MLPRRFCFPFPLCVCQQDYSNVCQWVLIFKKSGWVGCVPSNSRMDFDGDSPQLVLIYRPQRDRRLSRPWCEVAQAEIRTRNLPIANPALYHTATSTPKITRQQLSRIYLWKWPIKWLNVHVYSRSQLCLTKCCIVTDRSTSGRLVPLCRQAKKVSSRCRVWQFDQRTIVICRLPTPASLASTSLCTPPSWYFVRNCFLPSRPRASASSRSKRRHLSSDSCWISSLGSRWAVRKLGNLGFTAD